ncbi:MAG: LysR family transcriptional regulator [Steroidobacteraceae bacterium]
MAIALRHVRTFLAVAEHGSTAMAARHLHVSQPAVSVSIKQLEDMLGHPLFERRPPRGLRLTPFGVAKLPQARILAAELAAFGAERTATDASVGHVAFGYFTTLGPQYVPGVLRSMARRHPRIEVTPVEADLDELHSLLDSGRVELGLSYDVGLGIRMAVERVAELTPYALVPPRHALARKPQVTAAALAMEPLILVDLPSSREFLLSVFRSEGIEPRIGYRVRSIEMVVGMVANELGVSVLVTKPANLRAYDGKQVASRPLARTRIRQSVVLAHAARSTLTVPARALAQCIREHFAKGMT